jgi:hypothetical protein
VGLKAHADPKHHGIEFFSSLFSPLMAGFCERFYFEEDRPCGCIKIYMR